MDRDKLDISTQKSKSTNILRGTRNDIDSSQISAARPQSVATLGDEDDRSLSSETAPTHGRASSTTSTVVRYQRHDLSQWATLGGEDDRSLSVQSGWA